MANHDSGLIDIQLELGITVYPFHELEPGHIVIDLDLDMFAIALIPDVSGSILMGMELNTTVGFSNIVQESGIIVMFNLLDMTIAQTTVYCVGIVVNFVPQTVYVDLCKTKESDMIQRYKIDTYPLQFVFSMNGNHNISDYDFNIQTQIDGQSIYGKDGVKVDETNGLVTFDLDSGAMSELGTGIYQVNSVNTVSSYDAVVSTGVFEILDSLPAGA